MIRNKVDTKLIAFDFYVHCGTCHLMKKDLAIKKLTNKWSEGYKQVIDFLKQCEFME